MIGERICRFLVTWLKPYIKAYMYPLPTDVEVYMGIPGSITFEITKYVQRQVDHLECVHVTSSSADDSLTVPTVCIDYELQTSKGFMCVCRYLGRLAHLHPSIPEDAVVVDASLELLQKCVADFECKNGDNNHLAAIHLSGLEERMESDSEMIELDNVCLADICWYGAIQWMYQQGIVPQDLNTVYPNVSLWLERMKTYLLSEA